MAPVTLAHGGGIPEALTVLVPLALVIVMLRMGAKKVPPEDPAALADPHPADPAQGADPADPAQGDDPADPAQGAGPATETDPAQSPADPRDPG